MRNMKFVVLLSLISVAATAGEPAGIQFEHGAWQEVLEKARSTDRLIFIDVYTSWCGPCKQMAADVFPRADVGGLFNQSFINYKIDAEKGEGVQIAGSFNVKAYPTYLFVDGNGQLIYRSSGAMPVQRFLQEAQVALKEKDDPKPMAAWMAEYEAGERGKAFLIGYLKKRSAVKVSSAVIIEELMGQLGPEDFADKELVSAILYFDPAIEYLPHGKLFDYATRNYQALDLLLRSDKAGGPSFSLAVLQMGLDNYFKDVIVKQNRADQLPLAVDAVRRVAILRAESDESVAQTTKGMVMRFYAQTGNEQELILAAQDLVENCLLKQDVQAILAADAADYEKLRSASPGGDPAKQAPGLDSRFMKARRMVSFSYALRDAAEAIYSGGVQDRDALEKAAKWAWQANEYLPHFSSGAVYAGLLMKTGRQQEAIDAMIRASEDPILENVPDTRTLILDNVEKLKKGQVPKQLWNRR